MGARTSQAITPTARRLLGGVIAAAAIPWIAYALMTDQIGFVPGCLISASVQLHSFLRTSHTSRMEAMA